MIVTYKSWGTVWRMGKRFKLFEIIGAMRGKILPGGRSSAMLFHYIEPRISLKLLHELDAMRTVCSNF